MSHAALARAILRGFPSPIAVVEADGRIRLTNPAWQQSQGIVERLARRVPAVEENLLEILDSVDEARAREVASLIRAVLAADVRDGEVQVRLPPPDEDLHRVIVSAVETEDGRLGTVVFRAVDQEAAEFARPLWDDVTQQRVEEALRRSEARYRAIFESSAVGIALIDLEGVVHDANPALLELTGRNAGAPASEAWHFLGCLDADERRHMRAGLELLRTSRSEAWQRETRLRRADDGQVAVRIHVSRSRQEEGEDRAILMIEDISERRRLERQLRQAQRMESVGRLAGGIAHDFNNLLTVVRGHVDLILGDLAEDDPLRADLTEIREAGRRAAALTSQLLAFGRRNVLEPEVIDLNQVVDGMRDILSRTLGEDIDLAFDEAPTLGAVRADPTQIEQVLLNLVVNARDAMPHGGRLTVGTTDVELDDSFVEANLGATPGPHVALSVSDTGEGIDEQVLPLIFEPFFTTKPPGKGSGLGLSMTYGIVKQSGGYIEVESRPQHGSTFRIYLPRLRPEALLSDGLEHAERRTTSGEETVLLVEDDVSVRALAQRVLEARGFTVHTAGGGHEAIARARAVSGPIHLLLSDTVMPGVSGPHLAERLVRERPELRVILMSGFADEAQIRGSYGGGPWAFLPKPFTPEELTRKAREVLDAPE